MNNHRLFPKGCGRIFVCGVAILLTTCADDDLVTSNGADDGRIAFCMAATAATAHSPALSRAAYHEHSPLVLKNEGKSDTLYLHSYVMDSPIPSALPQTRGVPVDAGNFMEVCGSFSVSAYLGEALYINHATVSSYDGSIWKTDDSHYWPDNRTLDFYACAPSDVSDNITGLTMLQGNIMFDYTTPRHSDGEYSGDAEAQRDILFASASLCREDTENGIVPLRFHHALAGIKFVAGDVGRCTVKNIAIRNVVGRGRCLFSSADSQGGVFSWTFPEDVSASETYSQDFNIEVYDSPDVSQPITDKSSETKALTFMMIPQQLSANAAIDVTIDTGDGELKTLTGRIGDNGIRSWEAGKIYTYTISTSSVNWEYTFDVTESVVLKDGHVAADYQVTSFRSRINNPSVVEPVAWTAAPVDEQTASDCNLHTFTYSGDGSVTATSYPLRCRPLDLLNTTWPGDNTLRSTPSVGSTLTPYDLSTKGGSANMNTANCYMVHAPGVYKLPLVYGNAIKDGSPNRSAYTFQSSSGLYLTGFVDSRGKVISAPWLLDNGQTPAKGTLLWQDAIDIIRDLKVSEDRRYLSFSVNRTNLIQSNAVVAVTDAEGAVLWSWHIWVSEYNPETDPALVVTLDDYSDNSRKHGLLTRQLGWCDAKTLTYNGRDTKVRFTQMQSGKTADMVIRQTEYVYTTDVNNGTYYQWGRKDPVVGIRSYTDAYSVKRYYDGENNPHDSFDDDSGLVYTTGRASIAEAIANPCRIYCGNQHWVNRNSQYRNLWNNVATFSLSDTDFGEAYKAVKTVYDPSPTGFRIPDAFTFRIFSRMGKNVHTADEDEATVELFDNNLNGSYDATADKYRYTLYSQRNGIGQTVELVGTGVRYYTVNANGWKPGYVMNPTYVYTWISNGYNRTPVNLDLSYSFALGVQPGKEVAIWVGKGEDNVSSSMSRPVYCEIDE